MTEWQRIHIVGGAGSGKTTLARRLAAHRSVPIYDLDQVAYEGGAGAKRPLSARLADVRRIAAEPDWVTEGIYLWWTDELLRAADVVVWLDLPWRIGARRVVIRHLRASLAGTNRHRGIRKLLRFLRATRRYYHSKSPPLSPDDDAATSRAATVAALAEHGAKVVHCRRPADVRNTARALCSAEAREVRG
ncbi:MAG TPA: hypothetical protein VIG44_06295 [Thermomicrobiales bacterium]